MNSFDQPVLDDEKPTMAELLKANGYQTACIGTWHLGWDWNAIKRAGATAKGKEGVAPDAFDWTKPIPGGPLSHGFDYYFGDDVPNFPPQRWLFQLPFTPSDTGGSTVVPRAGTPSRTGRAPTDLSHGLHTMNIRH